VSHTPGPWSVNSEGRSHYVVAESVEWALVAAATPRYHGQREVISATAAEANARLIAAAPDLLAACRSVWEEERAKVDPVVTVKLSPALSLVAAAIAKAEAK